MRTNNQSITTDALKQYIDFKNMTLKEIEKVSKSGIQKALNQVQRDTKNNLKRSMGMAATRRSHKYSDSLVDGVRRGKVKYSNGKAEGYVTIAQRPRGVLSSSFLVKFFEYGTSSRKTTKGYNRGSIPAHIFFTNATASANQRMYDAMKKQCEKMVDKINAKK